MVWQTYFKFHLIDGAAPYLSQEFADANFEMYSKTLRGVTEQRARWKRGVDMTNAYSVKVWHKSMSQNISSLNRNSVWKNW
jgi:Predicted metalloendopeptidase